MNAQQFYAQQIAVNQQELVVNTKKYRFFSFLRLLAFISIASSFYFFWGEWSLAVAEAVLIGIFIFLVHKSLDYKMLKDKNELFLSLNDAEQKAQQGDWSAFEDGAEFKSSDHPYSNDMDLFGEKSVFQLLNRTVLVAGKRKLAELLAVGSKNPELTNVGIDELASQPAWCQNFIVEAKVRLKEEVKKSDITKLLQLPAPPKGINFLRIILPIISALAVIGNILNFIPTNMLIMILLGVMIVVGRFLKSSNQVILPVSELSTETQAMKQQLNQIGVLKIYSPDLKQFFDGLNGAEGFSASMDELIAIQKRMDYRRNLLIGVLLNIFLAWDFLVLHQFENWKVKHGKSLVNSQDELALVEAWVSGAMYKFNYPNTCYAEFTPNEEFHAIQLGHPFVVPSKQVRNDAMISTEQNFLIITGPNMAGKSTYLRSVGLAIIFANAGFPILAEKCVLSKYELYSSMRTSDNLNSESSYFHSELTRLRFIMDAIEENRKVFVILDEILKGTNSQDKEIGSAKFLQKLVRLKSKGIIATHDLSLTQLAIDTIAFKNVYFDSTINQDDLSFDYLVRDGVCKNMNASFLLKQMNLVD